jgi:protoporphyrin/coproporphyrin ferrochelatase
MSKKAILLVNLGSPDSPEVKDVKNYLREFLMDERVIDLPKFPRTLLVKGIIVPFRSPKSAAKYRTIWSEKGSPLIYITKELAGLVQRKTELPTYITMRYANPTPTSVLAEIKKSQPELEELIMLPLYPHYAMSSYETAVEHVKAAYQDGNFSFALKVVPPFYNHPSYIDALANSIRPFLNDFPDYDHVLFSYHGIPERHVKKTDPTRSHCLTCENCCEVSSVAHNFCYRHQIIETTRLVGEKLGLASEKFSFSFQSRLGADQWLKPYTAALLKEMPTKSIKKLLIISPAFVSDCLETLEEIHVEGKEDFMHAGGEKFVAVPCLNTNSEWVDTIEKLVNEVN